MKLRRLCALLLSFAMLLSLLSGCGGKKSEEDGRGDVISEEQGSDPGYTLDEPEVNFEDFFGCWEYWDYDIWLYVYGDGTYEMYHENGDCTAGSYTPEGTEIVLDSGERFALDGEGNLIDSDGEVLFASELPDFYYDMTEDGDDGWDDEDWDDEDYSPTVTAEDFYGCWEYTDTYTWVYIYGDGTYEWYDSEGLEVMGNYYMFGDELCLEDSGMSFTLDGSGGLVDAFGDTLFLSELPQW